jgi:hypothetical protein
MEFYRLGVNDSGSVIHQGIAIGMPSEMAETVANDPPSFWKERFFPDLRNPGCCISHQNRIRGKRWEA